MGVSVCTSLDFYFVFLLCGFTLCMLLVSVGLFYRLISVDESLSPEVDISALFREWSLQQWSETTPDSLQPLSLAGPESTTVHLSPLELKSLVLQLQRL